MKRLIVLFSALFFCRGLGAPAPESSYTLPAAIPRQAPVNAFRNDFARASIIRGNGPDMLNAATTFRSLSMIGAAIHRPSRSFSNYPAHCPLSSRAPTPRVILGIPLPRTSRDISRSAKSAGSTFPNPAECG